MKTGSGWMIPEFANVELRESPSGYFWKRRLLDLPKEYEIVKLIWSFNTLEDR